MKLPRSSRIPVLPFAAALLLLVSPRPAASQDFRVLEDTTAVHPDANLIQSTTPPSVVVPRVLLAGDSWAQYMWDDGSHNDIFDRFGFEDRRAVSLSLGSDPGAGYTGPEYAISGSEARQWADTAHYPWIANMVAALQANPTITLVVLSIGGNDVLAGKPGGGWYKDMDLDVPGSEAAFFAKLEVDTRTIIDAALAVRPDIRVMISSYDYPNFNVGFWCFAYACPKRRDLARSPDTNPITDAELNDMMVRIEQRRIGWVNSDPRLLFDHGVGLMHFFFGDGVAAARTLPYPGQTPPGFIPFPGGNPLKPTLRSNFRKPNGIDADPIHLNFTGYQCKITSETETLFFPLFRGAVTATIPSEGGDRDGWSDGTTTGTVGIRLGDSGLARQAGILSFDTSSIPDGAMITHAAIFLSRQSLAGNNPFTAGTQGIPQVDVRHGTFGAPAVEAADLTAPADAVDAGYVVGSAKSNGYAIRVELSPAGIAAINDAGTTQVRIAFPTITSGTGPDYVLFRDGDTAPPAPSTPPVLSDYVGTAAPFLDLEYSVQSAVPEAPRVAVEAAFPNPFRDATTIRFRLADAGPVRLDLFDVAGRLVTRLVDGEFPAGEQALAWDGRTERGTTVPAGIYFARLEAGGLAKRIRLVRTGE